MEPICIDSDDDVHAPGSGPAREGNQNGAAVATRHSTRDNRFLSTTQKFKVVLQLPMSQVIFGYHSWRHITSDIAVGMSLGNT